jgi:hypothetical protein
MAGNPEAIAVARALLSLHSAVLEMQKALIELSRTQDKPFGDHIEAAAAAEGQALEDIRKLIALLEAEL